MQQFEHICQFQKRSGREIRQPQFGQRFPELRGDPELHLASQAARLPSVRHQLCRHSPTSHCSLHDELREQGPSKMEKKVQISLTQL